MVLHVLPVVGAAYVASKAFQLGKALYHAFRPKKESPTLADIEARHQAEQAQKKAEAAAKAARDQAEDTRRQAERDRQQARDRQEEADRAAKRAEEEAQRLRAQKEEAEKAERHARELAQQASKAAKEEAERLTRQAQEERQRSQKIREDAEREMKAARKEAERTSKAAEEQRREAEAGKARAEEMARAAKEKAQKATEAKAELERCLKEGIQPVVMPTLEEVAAAKLRIQYKRDCFHFAVAGISGSGKSSLVNAFLGMRSQDAGSAAVGITETTVDITRYQGANPESPYIWYDVPGAGTLKFPDWKYFNNQGLYVFDCIIVLFDNRFTATDVAILTNAKLFKIPTYIVRSKADQHIRNIMVDMGYDSEADEGDDRRRIRLYEAARKQFTEKTKKSVQSNLRDSKLPDQRVYIVSNTTLMNVMLDKVTGRVAGKMIDELELRDDLFSQANSRRGVSGQ